MPRSGNPNQPMRKVGAVEPWYPNPGKCEGRSRNQNWNAFTKVPEGRCQRVATTWDPAKEEWVCDVHARRRSIRAAIGSAAASPKWGRGPQTIKRTPTGTSQTNPPWHRFERDDYYGETIRPTRCGRGLRASTSEWSNIKPTDGPVCSACAASGD